MTAVLRFEPHVVGSDLADLRGSVRLPGGEEDRHQPVRRHGNRSITAMRRKRHVRRPAAASNNELHQLERKRCSGRREQEYGGG